MVVALRGWLLTFAAVGILSGAPLLAQAAAKSGATTTLLEYPVPVPSEWKAKAPSSSMRLAEYVTPAEPAGSANVVVYFFGPGQGGSIDANLERWKSQFSNPEGGPVQERITIERRGFPTTIAEYRGTYARGTGMGSAAEDALPNHLLIAAVVQTPRGTLFFQCFGPVAAVEHQRDTYLAFVRQVK